MEPIYCQETDDPQTLKKHIENLNILLYNKQEEISVKDSSLQSIIQANRAIEREFRSFVDQITQEREQYTFLASQIREEKELSDARLSIVLEADQGLRAEIQDCQREIKQLRDTKQCNSEALAYARKRYKTVLYLLQQEHHKNLVNQIFKQEAESMQRILTQMNTAMDEQLHKYRSLDESNRALRTQFLGAEKSAADNSRQLCQKDTYITDLAAQLSAQYRIVAAKDYNICYLEKQLRSNAEIIEQVYRRINSYFREAYKAKQQYENELSAHKSTIRDMQEKLTKVNQQVIQLLKASNNYKLCERLYQIKSQKTSLMRSRTTAAESSAITESSEPNMILDDAPAADGTAKYTQLAAVQYPAEEVTDEISEVNEYDILKMLEDGDINADEVTEILAEATEAKKYEAQTVKADNALTADDTGAHIVSLASDGGRVLSLYAGNTQILVPRDGVSEAQTTAVEQVQRHIENCGITSLRQLKQTSPDDVFREIVNLKQIIIYKDMQIDGLQKRLYDKEIELEEWILKAQQYRNEADTLAYLGTENQAIKQQLDLLTLIKEEKGRQQEVMSVNTSRIKQGADKQSSV